MDLTTDALSDIEEWDFPSSDESILDSSSEQSTREMTLETLPLDVLYRIFCFLSVLDVVRLRMVCKSLHHATFARTVWSSLYYSSPLPRPPGPFTTQSTTFLMSTLIRSARVERNWAKGVKVGRILGRNAEDWTESQLAECVQNAPKTVSRMLLQWKEDEVRDHLFGLVRGRWLLFVQRDIVKSCDLDAGAGLSSPVDIYRPSGSAIASLQCVENTTPRGLCVTWALTTEHIGVPPSSATVVKIFRIESRNTCSPVSRDDDSSGQSDSLSRFDLVHTHPVIGNVTQITAAAGPRALVVSVGTSNSSGHRGAILCLDNETCSLYNVFSATPPLYSDLTTISLVPATTHLFVIRSFNRRDDPQGENCTVIEAFALPDHAAEGTSSSPHKMWDVRKLRRTHWEIISISMCQVQLFDDPAFPCTAQRLSVGVTFCSTRSQDKQYLGTAEIALQSEAGLPPAAHDVSFRSELYRSMLASPDDPAALRRGTRIKAHTKALTIVYSKAYRLTASPNLSTFGTPSAVHLLPSTNGLARGMIFCPSTIAGRGDYGRRPAREESWTLPVPSNFEGISLMSPKWQETAAGAGSRASLVGSPDPTNNGQRRTKTGVLVSTAPLPHPPTLFSMSPIIPTPIAFDGDRGRLVCMRRMHGWPQRPDSSGEIEVWDFL
ncbi:hypothetical protein HYDPIDRAFT_186734 [Hydnomerulius pinastri MD-312]|nr:hypothetical protein HYDPIDRAFT_186734 [Hydnomerulius pinastri MD-312]